MRPRLPGGEPPDPIQTAPHGEGGPPLATPPLRVLALVLILVSPLIITLFTYFLPISVDWRGHLNIVAQRPLHPHSVTSFFNPPWFALPLFAVGWLPLQVGQAVNAYLNLLVTALVVVRCRGTLRSLLVALTSLPFAALLLNGNVEWIPMTSFLIPPALGLPLLLTKPQSGILVAFVWFRQAPKKLLFLLPAALTILVSLFLWPGWPLLAVSNILNSTPTPLAGDANASIWPWTVPLGVFLMVRAWRREGELLAVASTLCLSPYFVMHSATLFMALFSARSPRWALLVSLGLWLLAIITSWHRLLGQ